MNVLQARAGTSAIVDTRRSPRGASSAALHTSPRQVHQRRKIAEIFGLAAQLQHVQGEIGFLELRSIQTKPSTSHDCGHGVANACFSGHVAQLTHGVVAQPATTPVPVATPSHMGAHGNVTSSAAHSNFSINPQAHLSDLEFQRLVLLASGPPSREKFYSLDLIEREIAQLQMSIAARKQEESDHNGASNEQAAEYVPPESTKQYPNLGLWKDWGNALRGADPLFYPSDPTTLSKPATPARDGKPAEPETIVRFLEKDAEPLIDGYWAYVYRVADNRISCNYTGEDPSTNNAVAHSYLASGGEVYAAGMLKVENGKVVMINTASGHYQPDPKVEMDEESCELITTSQESLDVFRKKLDALGLSGVTLDLVPFRHPNLVERQIVCQGGRELSQGGRELSAPNVDPVTGQPI